MEELANIPWKLIAPVLVLQFILMVIALIDLIKNQRTKDSFIMWLFIILLLNLIGPILYFIFGRRQE
ncbi:MULTISPECIES: PLDc N-terminal domain-containing protein [Sporosarcina]|uniref:PLDc N-terminal domain-containing protein n=1 Tax=Sporosarcina saromensis TaxID=359365 RepID=A0ABU4GCD7_9BACL|nr:PLDc N-terminal domain-containing protein [Sporosarcina saromensis]MDW0114566.1 PLDc N-terminal domain-containing protein [Sporosarcina saromensis]